MIFFLFLFGTPSADRHFDSDVNYYKSPGYRSQHVSILILVVHERFSHSATDCSLCLHFFLKLASGRFCSTYLDRVCLDDIWSFCSFNNMWRVINWIVLFIHEKLPVIALVQNWNWCNTWWQHKLFSVRLFFFSFVWYFIAGTFSLLVTYDRLVLVSVM